MFASGNRNSGEHFVMVSVMIAIIDMADDRQAVWRGEANGITGAN